MCVYIYIYSTYCFTYILYMCVYSIAKNDRINHHFICIYIYLYICIYIIYIYMKIHDPKIAHRNVSSKNHRKNHHKLSNTVS